MKTILLKPSNPLDVEPSELEDLAAAIRQLDLGYEVEIPPPEYMKGYGVTWWEVVNVYVPWEKVQDAAIGSLTTAITAWIVKRFKKVPNRPKSVIIWGPKGEHLKSVDIEKPEDG